MALSYSPTGSSFVAASGSATPAVYDRDGGEILRMVKGDVYLKDMAKTKGHTAAVTDAVWHPRVNDGGLTASNDGTLRYWDLNGDTTFEKLICNRCVNANKSILLVSSYVSIVFDLSQRHQSP